MLLCQKLALNQQCCGERYAVDIGDVGEENYTSCKRFLDYTVLALLTEVDY
jgi:hypothetical protein